LTTLQEHNGLPGNTGPDSSVIQCQLMISWAWN